MKLGFKKQTTIKQIPVPVITTEQRVEIAIRISLLVYRDKRYIKWAKNWLSGKDRAEWSAAESAESAARSAEWSAARSAESAAESAESAARSAAWSATSAEWSAARSAESATRSATSAANLSKIIKKVLKKETNGKS